MSQEPATNPDRRPDGDILSCIICKSELRDPVLLQCLHNACSTCLDEEASRQGSCSHITCNACEVATDVTRRINNSLLSGKVQYLTAQREAATCGVCRQDGNNEVSSDGFCIQCQQSLCVRCLTEHRRQVKQHKCVTFDDTPSWFELLKIPSSSCNEHEAELSLACFTCERPLCVQCGQSCYKGSHDVQFLDTPAAEQRLQKIKEKIERLIDDLDGSNNVLELLTKLPDSLQSAYDIQLNLYKQTKKAVMDAISSAFEKAVITLKDSYDTLQDKASPYVNSAWLLLRRIKAVSRYGRLVTSSRDAVGILSQLENVVSHLSELKDTLSHLREPVEASRLVHMVVRLPIDLEAIACSWIRPPQLCTEDPCSALDDLVEHNEDFDYITKEAQLEKKIKDHEDLAKRQREEYDLQLQELKNMEQKLQRQQVMQDEKEKSLKALQEKLDKLKTELELRERQQQANRMSIHKEQTDLQQLRRSLDEKEKGVKQLQENLEKQKKELQEKEAAWQFMAEVKLRVPEGHVLPAECSDVAVTADGHLLLAAMEHGMLEWDVSGCQLSSWTPTKTARGEDKVRTVDELQDGRAAVGLHYAETVQLLRRGGAARDSWQQEHVIQLRGPPLRLSVHAQLMAVAEDWRQQHPQPQPAQLPRTPLLSEAFVGGFAEVVRSSLLVFRRQHTQTEQLVLHSLTDGRELLRRRPGYCIQSVAATADAVITASRGQVQLSDSRKQYVVDSYSHSGQLVWRQSFNEMVYDLHWLQVLSVVYLALGDSNRVTAIRAVDGQQFSELLNSSHGLKEPWRLSLSRGPSTVLAVIHYDEKTVTVYPEIGFGGSK